MSIRVTAVCLFLYCFCVTEALFAQSFPNQGGYPAGYAQPVWNGTGAPGGGVPQMLPNPYGGGFTPQGQQPFMIPDGPHAGAQPFGQGHPGVMNAGAMGPQQGRGPIQPMFYGSDVGPGEMNYCPPQQHAGYMNPGQLFDDDGDEVSPLLTRWRPDKFPKETFVRLEYLLWDMNGPSNIFLGARQVGDVDPSVPFNTPAGVTSVTKLDDISVRDTNGIRGTFGIPLVEYGSLEFSSFLMEQARDKVVADGVSPLVATTVHVNGVQSNLSRLYDSAFKAVYTTNFWGANAKFIMMTAPPGEGFKIQPIAGISYLKFSENLRQEGAFNANRTIPDLFSKIESDTNNNLFGALMGARIEMVHRWFTVGVEPKISLGMNNYRTRVISKNFVNAADIHLITEIKGKRISPVADLGAYLRIKPTEHIELSFGYQLYWLAFVARAHDSLEYDVRATRGVPRRTNIHAIKTLSGMTIEGLTAGGQVTW